ncbi:MAG: hypothetical protein IIB95_00810 [Candidatus Marinimicrobia bacterium]|nr:hypothetical protein [Candidatus Neomarinimicrobiota bacterium]MCH7762265.1 hypothetical protein [Candidatus Neomarinimicrobiota bacterium]
MSKTQKITLILVSIIGFNYGQSDDKHETTATNPWSVSLNVFNRYVWRGTDYGNSPSIQSGIEYSTGSLTLGAWGAWQYSGNGNENDLYVSYSSGPLSFTITDYFFPSNSGGSDGFLDFNPDSGTHFIEASVSGEVSGIGLYAGYFFHEPGAEEKSIYANISYGPFMLGFGNGLYTTIDEDNGNDKFDVIELGITASNNMFSCSWILNPNQETTFLIVGMSF